MAVLGIVDALLSDLYRQKREFLETVRPSYEGFLKPHREMILEATKQLNITLLKDPQEFAKLDYYFTSLDSPFRIGISEPYNFSRFQYREARESAIADWVDKEITHAIELSRKAHNRTEETSSIDAQLVRLGRIKGAIEQLMKSTEKTNEFLKGVHDYLVSIDQDIIKFGGNGATLMDHHALALASDAYNQVVAELAAVPSPNIPGGFTGRIATKRIADIEKAPEPPTRSY